MSKDIVTRTSDATYDKLEFLRKNAGLNYFEMGKVRKARRDADKFLKRYRKIENDGLGVDYSKANAIEYELMLRKWEEICKPNLKEFGHEKSLSEFAKERMYVGLKDELNQKPNKKCLDFRNISSVGESEHLRTQGIIPAVIGPVSEEQYDKKFQNNISGLIYDYKDGYCYYRGRYGDNVTSIMSPDREKKFIISTIFNEYGEKVQIEGTTYSVEESDVLYITDNDKKYSLSEQQKFMMNKKKQEESIKNVSQPASYNNNLNPPGLNLQNEGEKII